MATYFFFGLSWIFNVSNNLSFADSINPMYFLMILTYLNLIGRGMWMFFTVEDRHTEMVGTLTALATDEPIYVRLKERHNLMKKKDQLIKTQKIVDSVDEIIQ
jgi:hypothetical protein